MPKLWTRPHVNGWRVYVEYVPALGEGDTPGRYVASALLSRAVHTTGDPERSPVDRSRLVDGYGFRRRQYVAAARPAPRWAGSN